MNINIFSAEYAGITWKSPQRKFIRDEEFSETFGIYAYRYNVDFFA